MYKKRKITPVIDYAKYKDKCQELDEAIKDQTTKNIAISGVFGAGKSSLIYTYEKAFNNKKSIKVLENYYKNEDYSDEKNAKLNEILLKRKSKQINKSIRISLASFNLTDKKSKGDFEQDIIKRNDNTDEISGVNKIKKDIENLAYFNKNDNSHINDNENEIEKRLLQQFIFNVPAKKLPDSRIKRVSKKNICKKATRISFIALFLTIIIFLINKYELIWIKNGTIEIISKILGIICIGICCYFIPFILNIKSLKIDKFELSTKDIDNSSGECLLNKYSDEIIYFFERTKIKIVYFEDLDRLPNLSVFNKLRELNFLLNNTSYLKEKIVFVYCVSDDILYDSEERNKFFDLIITVSPFLTHESVKKEISNAFGNEQNPYYCEDVSKFITDSRLLINILNDFDALVKKNAKLSIIKNFKIKLFTLSIYKNLYYYDYNKLNTKEDCITKAFKLISFYKNEEIESIKNKSKNIESIILQLADHDVNFIKFKERLAGIVYLYSTDYLTTYYHNDKYIDVRDLKNLSDFEKYSNFFINTRNNYPFISKDKLNEYWDKNERTSLTNYLNLLKLKDEDKNNERLVELDYLSKQIKHIQGLTPSQFMNEYNKSLTQNPETFINICFFKEYIDSDYRKLIFGNEYLLEQDDRFVRYNNYGSDYEIFKDNFDYKLDNLSAIVSQIEEDKFKCKSILNDQIIDFVFNENNNSNFESKKNNLKTFLLEKDDDVLNYFIHYIKDRKYSDFENLKKKIGIPLVMFEAWRRSLNIIKLEVQNKYLQIILNEINIFDCESELYEILNNYSEWEGISFDQNLINNLHEKSTQEIPIRLKYVSQLSDTALNMIFANQLFEINSNNLQVISKRIYHTAIENILEEIIKNDYSLIDYVIEKILNLGIDLKLLEKEALKIFDDQKIDSKIKNIIIQQVDFSIKTNIDCLDVELLTQIVNKEKLAFDLGVIYKVFQKFGFSIISSYFSESNFSKINGDVKTIKKGKEYSDFLEKIKELYLQNNACEIFKKFDVECISIKEKIEKENDTKILNLINSDYVSFSENTLANLCDCPISYVRIIEKNTDMYITLLKENKISNGNNEITNVLCNVNSSEIVNYIFNNCSDSINLSYNTEQYFYLILEKLEHAKLENNKIILRFVNEVQFFDKNIKHKTISLIYKNRNLFDKGSIVEMFKKIDDSFAELNKEEFTLLNCNGIVRYGLGKLEKMEIITREKIKNSKKNFIVRRNTSKAPV